jgi:phthalate 4,5-cis-dihydrodiol dehydrogenase
MREIIKSGELGRVKMIHNWYYNDWLYRPRTPEELDTGLGGGVTYRQGSHQFDIIRYLGGGLVRSVRASTGVWDPDRPTEGSHTVFLDFADGTAATAVYNGYDHFHTTELTFGIGEGGPLVQTDMYAKARRTLKNLGKYGNEAELKNAAGYGGERAKKYDEGPRHHPFFGLTIVSCEKGDIRQSPKGLFVYGEEEKYEVELPLDVTGRDVLISELYDAVVHGVRPLHDGNWAKANLEICIASLRSSRERKEILLSHQVAVSD